MAIKLGCPQCRETLIVGDEDPHWEFVCTECELPLEVLGGRTVSSTSEASLAPQVRELVIHPALPSTAGWQRVRRGLKLARWGYIITFFAFMFTWPVPLLLVLMFIFDNKAPHWSILLWISAIGDSPIGLSGLVLVAVSDWLLASAPSGSGARGFAIGGFSCVLVGLLVMLAALIMAGIGFGEEYHEFCVVLFALGVLILSLRSIFVALYFRTVARFFQNDSLAQGAGKFLLFWLGARPALLVGPFVLAFVFVFVILLATILFRLVSQLLGNSLCKFGPGHG